MRHLVLFFLSPLLSTTALAIDCQLNTTKGLISWGHGQFVAINSDGATEAWLCVNGNIYRPYRPGTQTAAARTPYSCQQYHSSYYQHHENEVPEACKSDDQRAREWTETFARNL